MRRLITLWRDHKGVTAVEFAFLTPALLLFLLGTVEIGTIFLTSAVLENAAASAARFGITGYTEESTSREEEIMNIITDQTSGIISPEDINISVSTLVYEDFDQIGQAEPYADDNTNGQYDEGESYTDVNGNGEWDEDMGASGAGGAGDVVVYHVEYQKHIFTPILRELMGDDGMVTLSANVVVRNEPYDYANAE